MSIFAKNNITIDLPFALLAFFLHFFHFFFEIRTKKGDRQKVLLNKRRTCILVLSVSVCTADPIICTPGVYVCPKLVWWAAFLFFGLASKFGKKKTSLLPNSGFPFEQNMRRSEESRLAVATTLVLLCIVTAGSGMDAPEWPLNFIMQFSIEVTNETSSQPVTVYHSYDTVTYASVSGDDVHFIRCTMFNSEKIAYGIDVRANGSSCIATMLYHQTCIVMDDYLLNGMVNRFFQGNMTGVKWTLLNSNTNTSQWTASQTTLEGNLSSSVIYEESATTRQPISLSLILEDAVIGRIIFLNFKQFAKGGDIPLPVPSCANINSTAISSVLVAKQPMIDAKCDACRFAANQLANQAVKAITGSTCWKVAGRVLGWCSAVTGWSNVFDLGATELGCIGASVATWVACSTAQSQTLGKAIGHVTCVPLGYCCPKCKDGSSCNSKTHTCEQCPDGYYGNGCQDPLPVCPLPGNVACVQTSCSGMVPIAALGIGEPRGTIVRQMSASCGFPKNSFVLGYVMMSRSAILKFPKTFKMGIEFCCR